MGRGRGRGDKTSRRGGLGILQSERKGSRESKYWHFFMLSERGRRALMRGNEMVFDAAESGSGGSSILQWRVIAARLEGDRCCSERKNGMVLLLQRKGAEVF